MRRKSKVADFIDRLQADPGLRWVALGGAIFAGLMAAGGLVAMVRDLPQAFG